MAYNLHMRCTTCLVWRVGLAVSLAGLVASWAIGRYL